MSYEGGRAGQAPGPEVEKGPAEGSGLASILTESRHRVTLEQVKGSDVWIVDGVVRGRRMARRGDDRLPDDTAHVYCMIEILAEVENAVLDAVGADFAMLPPTPLRFALHYGAWKPYRFWDGQTFEVPADFEAGQTADGSLRFPL